jgi:hypothetical protein
LYFVMYIAFGERSSGKDVIAEQFQGELDAEGK